MRLQTISVSGVDAYIVIFKVIILGVNGNLRGYNTMISEGWSNDAENSVLASQE